MTVNLPVNRRLPLVLLAVLAVVLSSLAAVWAPSKPNAATLLTVKVSADSYVRSDQPDANFGTAYTLAAEAGSASTPTITTYVRFTVSGLTMPPASAQLQLYSYSTSNQGISVSTASNDWTETGITYNNAPAAGPVIGTAPTVTLNTWASADVTPTVTGNGTYTFAITTTRTTMDKFGSREASTGNPKLVLTPGTTNVAASSGSGQSTQVGTAFGTPLTAAVTTGSGAAVPNVQVTFTAPSSGASGTFPGGAQAVSVTTDANGMAQTPPFTANSVAGSYAVSAATPDAGTPASFALTNVSAAPSSSATPGPTTSPTVSPSATVTPSLTPSATVGPSATASSQPPASSSFQPNADSYVRSDQPTSNFGTSYVLYAEAGSASTPTMSGYLRFPVSGLSGVVTAAALRLYSYSTSSDTVTVSTASNSWTESGITYANAPSVGPTVGSAAGITLYKTTSIDVMPAVSYNGTYTLVVNTNRLAADKFASREASGTPPRLVITTAPGTVTAVGGATQSTMVGTAFGAPLAAKVVANGAPVPGAHVTFTAPSSGASGTFAGGATTATVTADGSGVATSPPFNAGLTAGSYQVVASVWGASQSASFALTDTDPTIVAAGDIACTQGSTPTATSCQQVATSNLAISLHPNAVLPLGDDQYELGSLSDFQAMYDPSWGRLNAISHPVPGNHEYGYLGSSVQPTGGAGYFTYFGDISHPLQPGCTSNCTSWYSWNIGAWHMIALDSQCAAIGGCNPGNPEYNWLQADLKTNTAKCTLAYWHIPIYSSSIDHQPDMQAIYQLLYTKGADVVLNGHAHFYERFAAQDGAGNADPVNGIPEFIVGSGGRSFFPVNATPAANSVTRIANTFGVLQMTLSNGSYSWNFVPVNSGGATDSGTGTCH